MTSHFGLVLIFVLALTFMPPTGVHAQNAQTLLKTQSGCSVVQDNEINEFLTIKNYTPNSALTVTWAGECVNGLAHGKGALHIVFNNNSGDPTYASTYTRTFTTKMNKGKAYGFVKVQSNNKFGSARTQDTEWRLEWGGRVVSFSGLGLRGDESLLDNRESTMPSRADVLIPNTAINDGVVGGKVGEIRLKAENCLLAKPVDADCDYKQPFETYHFTNWKSNGITVCPQPKTLTSCSPIANQLVGPYVLSVEAFIRDTMPRVREVDAEMQSTLAEARRQQEIEIKRQAAAAVLAASEQAAANASFEAKLDTMPIGELFSIADEFKSKGDLNRARKALRQLMSRFPDHKLAEMAARMLTELQGK